MSPLREPPGRFWVEKAAATREPPAHQSPLKEIASSWPLCALAFAALIVGCAGDQEIERPAPLYGEVPIDYPIELWDQDIEGQTMLRVRVTDMGRVDSVVVLESSGHEAFDSAAIAGARELRFRPARRKGKRIVVWAEVPVHFSKRPRPDSALSL
ncbi:MAG: energy transducer TonB [Gemmatimonadetes bacterium]|nr:energy transducer TonB [Gemmatimonadota bacterium]